MFVLNRSCLPSFFVLSECWSSPYCCWDAEHSWACGMLHHYLVWKADIRRRFRQSHVRGNPSFARNTIWCFFFLKEPSRVFSLRRLAASLMLLREILLHSPFLLLREFIIEECRSDPCPGEDVVSWPIAFLWERPRARRPLAAFPASARTQDPHLELFCPRCTTPYVCARQRKEHTSLTTFNFHSVMLNRTCLRMSVFRGRSSATAYAKRKKKKK